MPKKQKTVNNFVYEVDGQHCNWFDHFRYRYIIASNQHKLFYAK